MFRLHFVAKSMFFGNMHAKPTSRKCDIFFVRTMDVGQFGLVRRAHSPLSPARLRLISGMELH